MSLDVQSYRKKWQKQQNPEVGTGTDDSREEELDKDKYDLAEASFKTVLDADIHLDNKASRILSAIAFLTASAAAVFNKAYSSSISKEDLQAALDNAFSLENLNINSLQLNSIATNVKQNIQIPKFSILGIDLALFSFTFYIIFVLLGAIFYLFALGPSLNIPAWLTNESSTIVEKDEPISLFFFKTIGEFEEEKWKKFWKQKESKYIRRLMTENFPRECYLIAEKAKTKIKLMSFGSLFFKLAFVSLAPLVLSLLPLENLSLILFGIFLVFLVFTYASLQRPSSKLIKNGWTWITVTFY